MLSTNSQNYSCVKTPVPEGVKLPLIVVQMPVYKEDLDEVIAISYFNVKKAMDFYESMGGRCKYFICDDGFQVIDPTAAAKRAEFYHKHGIAFVARPPTGRLGVFKKASNLNYQLHVSKRTSEIAQERGICSEDAMLLVWEELGRACVVDGDLILDDDALILLIDADTKVSST